MNGHDDVIQSLLQHRASVDLKENVSAKYILKRSNLLNINLRYKLFSLKIYKIGYLRNFYILMIIVLSSLVNAFSRMVEHL